MRRWVGHSLVLLSTLLCLFTAFLWVRSYWMSDRLWLRTRVDRVGNPSAYLGIYSGVGGILFSAVKVKESSETKIIGLPGPFWHDSESDPVPASSAGLGATWEWGAVGFGGWTNTFMTRQSSSVMTGIYVPHWFLLFLFAIIPFVKVRRALLLRRRAAKGCCTKCGYDLRASPEKCPECGTAV